MKKAIISGILVMTFTLFYGQVVAEISNFSGSKSSCNLNSSEVKQAKANVCNGSFCDWTDGEQGTNFGKCG